MDNGQNTPQPVGPIGLSVALGRECLRVDLDKAVRCLRHAMLQQGIAAGERERLRAAMDDILMVMLGRGWTAPYLCQQIRGAVALGAAKATRLLDNGNTDGSGGSGGRAA